MGLSTKQVSSDGLDNWSQALLQEPIFELPKARVVVEKRQENPQVEQLKCPRCESTNTKFCYYNNYNKTQPRHFCRACKRHWTKGGTLRNVPVGGHCRKNKHTRKPNPTSASKITTNPTRILMNNTILAFDRSNGIQSSIITSSELDNHLFSSNLCSNTTTSSIMPFNFLQGGRAQELSFPFSSSSTTSSSFDTISTSFQSPSLCNYLQEQFTSMEEPTITSIIPQANHPSVGGRGGAYTSKDWNWEDIETLVSTDLNVAWDDSNMNPL